MGQDSPGTARAWLVAREPTMPVALARRLAEAVHASPATPDQTIPEQLVSAGERVLRDVLRAPHMSRVHALDVLAADALVTYAFEAAADEPDRLADRAAAAMQRMAALAGDRTGTPPADAL